MLALLRRAMMFHHPITTPGGGGRGEARREIAAGTNPLDASRSRTERDLQALGIGQPPDRAETGIPGYRW
jgi:hypothetical protein